MPAMRTIVLEEDINPGKPILEGRGRKGRCAFSGQYVSVNEHESSRRRLPCGKRVRWRRRRDSNPRDPFGPNGFQDRRFQPLTHSSVFNSNVFFELAANLLHWQLQLLHFGAEGVGKAGAKPTKSKVIEIGLWACSAPLTPKLLPDLEKQRLKVLQR